MTLALLDSETRESESIASCRKLQRIRGMSKVKNKIMQKLERKTKTKIRISRQNQDHNQAF